jgi:hypothetical protein
MAGSEGIPLAGWRRVSPRALMAQATPGRPEPRDQKQQKGRERVPSDGFLNFPNFFQERPGDFKVPLQEGQGSAPLAQDEGPETRGPPVEGTQGTDRRPLVGG